jgi:hypothetical protein
MPSTTVDDVNNFFAASATISQTVPISPKGGSVLD